LARVPMTLPQHDLLVLLSGPIILLVRFVICNAGKDIHNLWICEPQRLVSALQSLEPWEAFYALQPKAWSDAWLLLLLCILLLLALWYIFLTFAPKTPTVYIQPSAGLHELLLRLTSMFMRSVYAIAYIWAFYKQFPNSDKAPDTLTYGMHAICSHYIIRGVEALLLRRYSSPFFPPQLSQPYPLVCGVAVYLYHYVLIYAHFQWMTEYTDWGINYGSDKVNRQWMYIGYAISVFGQVMMLKQADEIPKGVLFQGSIWRGEVLSWIGIGFISQHPGVWLLVLSMIPFSSLEELVEMWTGQRYARLCTSLRSANAVLFKDVPDLAEEVAPALAAEGNKYGSAQICIVRPRSTRDTSDVYVVFTDDLDAGMAASHLDGKTVAGWRANAMQRKY